MKNLDSVVPENDLVLDPVLPPSCDGDSPSGACPQIFHTNRNSVIVQGYVLSDIVARKIQFAENELGVEIPEALFLAAAGKIGGII
ncbi:MAG TPA: hypothetical protein VGZ00_06335 [Candidatus Baltobacteraceae bacterium]|jgi:hypothetical protein|nr:hypothetical protein [Candidatus Baltobacteraceae bacterium]